MRNTKRLNSNKKSDLVVKTKFTEAEAYLNHKYDFRRNTVSLEIELKEKGERDYHIVNENSLFRELQLVGKGISVANIVALIRSDFIEDYDPLVHYFRHLHYDGVIILISWQVM